MAFDYALLGFTVLGVALNSAAGWFKNVQLNKDEKTNWKKLGVSLVQAVLLGLAVGFSTFDPATSSLVGFLGAKTLDKVGAQYE